MGTLRENRCTFLIICHPFLLRMRNILDKSCKENQSTHFMFNDFFFISFENRAVCERRWEYIVERGRPQMTVWRMCIACWIPKAKNTH